MSHPESVRLFHRFDRVIAPSSRPLSTSSLVRTQKTCKSSVPGIRTFPLLADDFQNCKSLSLAPFYISGDCFLQPVGFFAGCGVSSRARNSLARVTISFVWGGGAVPEESASCQLFHSS
jgi:hypothetical protein